MRKKRTKAKTCPHKNLTRCEGKPFNCFKLSIQRRGFQFTRYFSEKKYGGWKGAENAALAARDKILARIEGMSDEELLRYVQAFQTKTEV